MKQVVCMISLVVALSSSLFAEEKVADALAVRIVPERTWENGKRIIETQPEAHFHVIITNLSDKPVRLWRDWCSWGEQTLSFEVTDENGNAIVVKRSARSYRKNYPDLDLIPPGDHKVCEVSFGQTTDPTSDYGTNAPLPEKGKTREVKMKAVFKIPEDEMAKEKKVWTGKVCSPEETYTIHRTR